MCATAAGRRSSPTKCSPTTSSNPARRDRPAARAARQDVLSFALGGLSKSIGLPQVKLGWIAAAGPDGARRRGARTARVGLRHLPVGLDAGAGRRRRAARARRRGPRTDRGARGRELPHARSRRPSRRPAASCAARAAGTPSCRCRRSSRRGSGARACSTTDGVLAHPGYFFDFPRESFLVVSLLPPEAVFAGGVARVLRHFDCTASAATPAGGPANMNDAVIRTSSGRRRAGLLIPLFSCPSTSELGHRRHRRHRADRRLAGRRRPARAAAAADQRDGARPAVAVLGDQRDGDRSDLHQRAGGARVRRARRRSVADGRRSRAARGRPAHAAHRPRGGSRAEARRAARRVRAVPRERVEPRHATRARRSGVSQRAGLVDRGLRLFRAIHAREGERPWTEWPEALQRREPAAIDRDAARARRTRCCSISTCSGWPIRNGGRRAAARTASSCSAICRSWSTATARTSGRGSSSFDLDVSLGVPPDAFSATGQDWGMPVYRWDVVGAGGFPLAARARAAQRRPVRRIPRRSPRRLLSHLRAPERRRRAVLHAARRADADGARRAPARDLPRTGRRDHRRGSRHRSRLRARVAGAARRSRVSRLPLGAALARRKGSRSAIRRTIRRCRSRRPARTTPSRSSCGGKTRRKTSGGRSASCRRFSGSRRAPILRTRRTRKPCATCCSKRCSRRDRTCCCCRFRTSSAGAIASTSRPRSPIKTGRSACRGRSIGWRTSRGA